MYGLPKLNLRRVVSEAIVDAWQRLCRLDGRAASLVKTKIEEAQLWLARAKGDV